MITSLKDNQFIVVGTNLAGEHLGGAASQAHAYFGLEWGIGEGLSGQTYAFPTLGETLQKLTTIRLKDARNKLYSTCKSLPDKEFLLTAVGTGIAGYGVASMANIFINPPANLVLPAEVREDSMNDPYNVCRQCGMAANTLTCLTRYGEPPKKIAFDISPFHIDNCDFCDRKVEVTEVRDYFYPDFKLIRKNAWIKALGLVRTAGDKL